MRFDAAGNIIGITLVGMRGLLERDGAVKITLREHEIRADLPQVRAALAS